MSGSLTHLSRPMRGTRRRPWCLGAASLVAAWLLAGCALGPDGQPPALPEPAHYGAEPALVQTEPAQGVAQALVPGRQPVAAWWRQFGVPELDAWVAEAWQANADLAAADHRLEAARALWRAQAGATQWPSVDLGGQAARQRALGLPMAGLPPTSLYDTVVGQVQVRYTFDLFGMYRERNRAAARRVAQQGEQWRAARDALAANVVSGAISLAGLQAQLDLLDKLIASTGRDLSDLQRQQALGAVPRVAVADVQRQAATLASQRPPLAAQQLALRHALAVLLGRSPDQAPLPLPLSRFVLPMEVPVLVPSALLAARPDVQAAEAALRAAAHDVGAATADLFPRLTLSASMGQGGFDWATATSGAGALWNLAGGIAMPLFQGGALRAQRAASVARYEAAAQDYRQTVLSAFQQVADALAAVQSQAQSLALAEAAHAAASQVADDTARRVALGALPVAMARVTARQAAQAQLDVLDHQQQRWLDIVRLFHAMGSPPLGSD